MIYKGNKPYPTVRVEKPNHHYASLLLEDYAGTVSEDTAIHLYLFQFLIANNEIQEYANAMKKIAEVEMHHLRLLGETIKLLGLNPAYGTVSNYHKFNPFTSLNVNYTTNLKLMIEADIQSEQKAITQYQYHRSIIQDKYVKQLLTRIIEDEEVHLDIFYYFYKKFFSP